ncbi:MAG: class I SAM-dependent methyltransferase [Ignavibacteriales bacterium]|nr:class I SAM-dependent methyltransferase [Ignavibacteriales bacterium]
MHERRYQAEIDRLRSPERIERLEVQRVIGLSLEGGLVRSVLDVGTGSGIFAEAFAKKIATVVGIDANPEMIEVSKGLVPGASFQKATAESIPYADKTFDLVFLGLVLHEADDAQKALSESRRCAKRSVAVLEWPYKEEEMGPPLEHRLKSEDIAAMAKEVGFKALTITPLKVLVLHQFLV